MVYSSDFYTTRRPYTRPISSSYTVTPIYTSSYIPTYSTLQVRTFPYYYPPMPYVAHKRLVTIVHTPASTVYRTSVPVPIRIYTRLRPSLVKAELDRIRNRLRPSLVSYTEKYLNSKDNITLLPYYSRYYSRYFCPFLYRGYSPYSVCTCNLCCWNSKLDFSTFDDEAKDIRVQADSLLRRINVFVPRHIPSDYAEVIIPERMRSDDYIRRLLTARKNDKREDVEDFPWYRTHMGDGSLACVKYVGGRPQPRRKPYYTLADCIPGDVQNDVNLLSYYLKNRQAAENATPAHPLSERELRKERALAMEEPPRKPKKVVEPEPEPEVQQDWEPEIEREIIEEHVREKKKEKKEKKQKDKEEEVKKRLDEEALKRAEEFLSKKAEEARLEEERRQKAEAERLRLEKEAEEARIALEKAEAERRLAEILEQERLEAIRKAEEEKAELARQEAERIAAEEKRLLNLRRIYADAIASAIAEDEERVVQAKNLENLRRLEEEEEKLASGVVADAADNGDREDEENLGDDKARLHELTDQEREERQPEEVQEDTKVEEDEQIEDADQGLQESIKPVTGGEEISEIDEEPAISSDEVAVVEENDVFAFEETTKAVEFSSSNHEEEVSAADDEAEENIIEERQDEEEENKEEDEEDKVEETASADREETDIPEEDHKNDEEEEEEEDDE